MLLTSESVTEGHPDKICDKISDAILDSILEEDKNARVAIECLVTTGSVHIAGEVTTNAKTNYQQIARKTLKDIGYTNPDYGIDYEDAGVWISINDQSKDIARGVNKEDQGAGDQGMMYGYACKETDELMPLPIILSHKLTKKLGQVRKEGEIEGLGPDGKSQVTVEYDEDNLKRIHNIVIAQQHIEKIDEENLKKEIEEKVIIPICGEFMDDKTKIHINATGKFVIGGPEGDSGVTGRKIMVDTYGGIGRHGGGCFSGKDPSKVDRSGAYAARWVAKNLVAADIADKCEVMISYAIGMSKPTSINVNCFGTEKISENKIREIVDKVFDLRPNAIIKDLDLLRPIYKKTAAYGHFGRNEEGFNWEKINKVEEIKNIREELE